jgi:hypothetical protein
MRFTARPRVGGRRAVGRCVSHRHISAFTPILMFTTMKFLANVRHVGAVHASLAWPFAQAQLITRILAVGGCHLASQVISEPGGHRLVTTSHFIVLVVDTGSTAVTAPSFYLTMMIST